MTFFGPTNYLTLCNAGHPSPLFYRASERRWTILEQRASSTPSDHVVNIPLGIDHLVDYEQFGIELSRGDLVLCYSDSLIEARDATGEMLGERGLLRVVEDVDVSNPAALVASLRAKLANLNPNNLADDDVTTLLFRANGAGLSRVPFRRKLLAPWRIASSVFHGRAALPDLTVTNLLGAMSWRFNRGWNASRFRD
jgi:hypothetical protein